MNRYRQSIVILILYYNLLQMAYIMEKNWEKITLNKTENMTDVDWNSQAIKVFVRETTIEEEIEKQNKLNILFDEAKNRKDEQDSLVTEMQAL